MSKLNFLSDIKLVAQEEQKPKVPARAKKDWNPTEGLTVRVWKDGSVFPSQQLVDQFDLSYRPQPTEEEIAVAKAAGTVPYTGQGFDVADSQDFPIFQTGGKRLLIISPAPRSQGRIDLFGSVGYNKKDNTPLYTVMNQGAATFGETFLVPRIEGIYGIVFAKPAIEAKPAVVGVPADGEQPEVKAQAAVEGKEAIEGVEYVDMVLLGQGGEGSAPWTLPAGKTVAFFPKIVSKGEKRGEQTIARRENPLIFVFYPKSLLDTTVQAQEAPGNGQAQ